MVLLSGTMLIHVSGVFLCDVDNARQKRTLKRGGEHSRIEWLAADLPLQGSLDEILALDESLARLSENNRPAATVVKLYYFAGLTLEQIALVQGISRPTVAKHLAYGRAWLHRELSREDEA
jgi:RNA polymerase sigma factor (sigma-70 family)